VIEKVSRNDWPDVEYIRPVPESGHIFYDFAELGRKRGARKAEKTYIVQWLLNLDTSKNEEILNFVNHFGLLGLLQHYYGEIAAVTLEGKTPLHFAHKPGGFLLINAQQVADLYLISLEDFLDNDRRQKAFASEPLIVFKKEVEEFQKVGELAHRIHKAALGSGWPLRGWFSAGGMKELAEAADNETLLSEARKRLCESVNRKIQYMRWVLAPGEEGRWSEHTGFDSLISVVYYLLAKDIESNFWCGRCERCNGFFLSSVGSQRHCTRQCEDAARKAKKRQAVKPANKAVV
jgi:hypothetical protein